MSRNSAEHAWYCRNRRTCWASKAWHSPQGKQKWHALEPHRRETSPEIPHEEPAARTATLEAAS